jgi:fucose permease
VGFIFTAMSSLCLWRLLILNVAILEEVRYPAREEDTQSVTNKQSKYKQMWKLKVVHLLAFFIFAYCGVEVTMGGMLTNREDMAID